MIKQQEHFQKHRRYLKMQSCIVQRFPVSLHYCHLYKTEWLLVAREISYLRSTVNFNFVLTCAIFHNALKNLHVERVQWKTVVKWESQSKGFLFC